MASLFDEFAIGNPSLPTNTKLVFTKSQIIFPENMNGHYTKSYIKDRVKYKLIPHDNIDIRFRYEMEIEKNIPIRLGVDKINERKLKWIHKLYPVQKNEAAFYALIVASIAALAAIVRLILQALK